MENLKVILTPEFEKSVKKLEKKYKEIFTDLKGLETELRENSRAGVNLGKNCFKIRLQNSSVPTGKSGGFRVIYFFKEEDNIYLLAMYSKSDLYNIDEKQLIEILVSNKLK